ncbi:MAG: SDR family NAD(P)-dependent oxidoreductase [Myxococcales bacterium]
MVGAGAGNGSALGRCFSAQGYRVGVLARNPERLRELAASIPRATAFPCDVTDSVSLEAAIDESARELGDPDVLIYNAGNYVPGGVGSTSPATLERCYRENVAGCLSAVQRVVPGMRARGTGSIVVIGATASTRGAAHALPFAAAKAGQRNMVQSMARELSPLGIHVAYVVIDGVIDSRWTRALFAKKADSFFIQPDAVASAVLSLVNQPRSGFTFELDLRPHAETW